MLNVAAALLLVYAVFWIAGAFIAIYPAAGAVGVAGLVASVLSWRRQRAAVFAAMMFSTGVGALWMLDVLRWFSGEVSVGTSGVFLGGIPTVLAVALTLLVVRGLRVRAN